MTRANATFQGQVAIDYEAWYETPEGQRADTLEKAVLGQLLRALPDVQSVLEVGCGTGHFSRWMSAQGLAVVGLDLSVAMLAQARIPGDIPIVQGDAQRLPFPDGSFDLVAFITTLEFLRSPAVALGEALRVSRQGLILGVLNRWSFLAAQRRLTGLFHASVYATAHFYGVGELERLLRSMTKEKAHIEWQTTLFPRWWPCTSAALPWGGFLAMVLVKENAQRHRSMLDLTCTRH